MEEIENEQYSLTAHILGDSKTVAVANPYIMDDMSLSNKDTDASEQHDILRRYLGGLGGSTIMLILPNSAG